MFYSKEQRLQKENLNDTKASTQNHEKFYTHPPFLAHGHLRARGCHCELFVHSSNMARTKQTARRSTGGKSPAQQRLGIYPVPKEFIRLGRKKPKTQRVGGEEVTRILKKICPERQLLEDSPWISLTIFCPQITSEKEEARIDVAEILVPYAALGTELGGKCSFWQFLSLAKKNGQHLSLNPRHPEYGFSYLSEKLLWDYLQPIGQLKEGDSPSLVQEFHLVWWNDSVDEELKDAVNPERFENRQSLKRRYEDLTCRSKLIIQVEEVVEEPFVLRDTLMRCLLASRS